MEKEIKSEKRISRRVALASLCKRTDLPEGVVDIIKEGIEAYEKLSIEDGLTGLYNRRYFDNSLSKEIARSTRHESPLSLIILDVDNFKKYNDNYGHTKGDSVLREVGSVIKSPIRKIDIPCRYGGEEFAVILPETVKGGAVNVAEKIRKGIEKKMFCPRGKDGIHVSASFGVAQYEDKEPAEEFVKRADSQLYHAKETGRNRVCFD